MHYERICLFCIIFKIWEFQKKQKLEGLDDVIWQYTDKTCSDYIAKLIFSHSNVRFIYASLRSQEAQIKSYHGPDLAPALQVDTCALDSSETLLLFWWSRGFADFCCLGLIVMISCRHLIVLGQKTLQTTALDERYQKDPARTAELQVCCCYKKIII